MRNAKPGALLACVSLVSAVMANDALAGPKSSRSSLSQAFLSFSADKTEYAVGESATLSWASSDTRFCQASGDWDGKMASEGTYRTPPLDASKSYSLKCMGQGGGVEGTVIVAVAKVTDPVPDPVAEPSLTFNADDPLIAGGDSTTLRWTGTDTDACTASGGWSGDKASSGSESVAPDAETTYTLTCTGAGGSTSASVTVAVDSPPPTLSFSVADPTVAAGDSTTLSWTAANADACTASGGWSGARADSGVESVGPISAATTYTLACSGPGGSVVKMLGVSAIGDISITWAAPIQNVDGTSLTDLAGFRIYHGAASGSHTDMVEVDDPAATSHDLSLASGTHFVVMTALDDQGNESAHSNEVTKILP